MDKGIKIFVGVVVALAVISIIFLVFAKKRTQTAAVKTSQRTSSGTVTKSTTIPAKQNPVVKKDPAIKTSDATRKTLIRTQWQQCKSKTLATGTTLFWNSQVIEGIPAGGAYAKGLLDNNSAYPMHITIRSGIANADKIKQSLVVGKMVFLRGTCAGTDSDGSVVFQAF